MRSQVPDSLGCAWRLDPQVALRAERFGALAYHYGTRRLTFLKSKLLVDVVEALEHYSTAHEACRAAGIEDEAMPRYERALAALAEAGMIEPRAGA